MAGLKRHCHLLGIDVAADLGSPAIRIFAGDVEKGQPEAEARRYSVGSV